ncbi:MAG: zf-TFIIB domain-containing protein [Zoogloeaceae bacterium]|nr:zf-TFIIB domain-containing protein [Zoogloeaceae bacterium]
MKKLYCHCGGGKGKSLERHTLSEGLSAKACPECQAVVLLLEDYQEWRERHFSDSFAAVEPAAVPGQEKPSKAHVCPQCGCFMQRYRTGDAASFWLDYCPACHLFWLDAGEWALLEQSGLALYLDTLLTERWQHSIQSRKTLSWRDELLQKRFGEETLNEIRRIQSWLRPHPKKRDILAFLGENL